MRRVVAVVATVVVEVNEEEEKANTALSNFECVCLALLFYHFPLFHILVSLYKYVRVGRTAASAAAQF